MSSTFYVVLYVVLMLLNVLAVVLNILTLRQSKKHRKQIEDEVKNLKTGGDI